MSARMLWLLIAALLAAASPGFSAESAKVAAVAFAPADRVGPYRYADLVAVRAGDPLTPDLLERSLRLLRATGLFAEVDARQTDGPAGTNVLFTLRPHLLVREVGIKGNFLVLERDLASLLRLRPAEPFNEEIVRGDIERVIRHYDEQGYEGTTVVEEISRGVGEVSVTYRIGEGRPRVVREIVLRGNLGLGRPEVLGALGMSRYTFFRGANLQRGLESLRDFYQRRGYLDVRISSRVDASEGSLAFLAVLTNPIKGLLSLGYGGYRLMTITVEIDEGRRFEAEFLGLAAFMERDLRPLLTFQRSGFFDEEEVAAGRERILAFYQERGWYLAEVDARADYDAGRVVYVVRENRPVPVAEVRLVGFTHFGENWVRQRLATRASSGEEARLLRTSQLESDRKRIQSWYRDAGFTRVEVPPPEIWPEAGPAGAVVIYKVHEGPRSLLRAVSFTGAVALSNAELLAAAGLTEGAPYREADLQKSADRVRVAYARAGYPQCVVTLRPDFGTDRTKVDLRFIVEAGRLQRLGNIAVTGNRRTSRRVILRELPLTPGDPLDPEALTKGKNALYDLGLFREVRYVLPEPVSPEGPQDLVLAVRERPTGFVGFGVGYASDERFRGFVEAGEQSLFGTGRSLRWKTKLSEIGDRHDLFYQEPWLLDYDLQGQVDLYLGRQDEPGYKVRRRGLALGVNREFTSRLLLNVRYRYEFVNYSDVVPDLTAELGALESFSIGSLIPALGYDRRDNPISPRSGSYYQASVEVARPLFGGDASFTKYQVEASWYLPLLSRAGIALGLRGGFTQLLLSAGDLPLSERFFLGGNRSVRGYSEKGIGPKDETGNPLGGDLFAQGNVELRFGLYKKLHGVLFFDAGELWADQAGLPASGVKTSAGAGIRYETLVGPIRLDWAYKLRREPGESPSRWHLTIGYPF
ncbi:MAG: outer membrane protein assembly factor BamA [Candidatus Methylomirabilia bacterium]